MGQKVNPIGFRLGINKTWSSRWFAKKLYKTKLHEDFQIKKIATEKLKNAGVSRVIIERSSNKMLIVIFTSKPGIVIGKKGADLDAIKKEVGKITKDEVKINIVEIKKAELDAKIVADSITQQIERRVAFRKALKKAVQTTMKFGAKGIRINCSGRLNGSEIARMEWYREGKVPLHTLRADIDYGESTSFTTYGACGIKVWIYKGYVEKKKVSTSQI
jgi:small subunit ribosomal protein S3